MNEHLSVLLDRLVRAVASAPRQTLALVALVGIICLGGYWIHRTTERPTSVTSNTVYNFYGTRAHPSGPPPRPEAQADGAPGVPAPVPHGRDPTVCHAGHRSTSGTRSPVAVVGGVPVSAAS